MDNPDPHANENAVIRAMIYAREQEFHIIQAQLQQQLDLQYQMMKRSERNITAATDRILRRLDRMERRGEGGNDSHGGRSSRYRG
jgi:hypothetical protein